MPQTSAPTRYGPNPDAGPEAVTALEKMAPATKTRTRVPRISLIRFVPKRRIAGAVQNRRVLRLDQRSLSSEAGSEVRRERPPRRRRPSAQLGRRRTSQTHRTIRQSPSSQPDSGAHRCCRKTFATTPSPNNTSTSVPIKSPTHCADMSRTPFRVSAHTVHQLGITVSHEAISNNQAQRNGSPPGERQST